MDPSISLLAERLARLLDNRPAEAGIHAAASRASTGVRSDLAGLTAPSATAGSARLVGLDHELKGLGSLRDKLARPGATGEARDGLRYTLVLGGMNFASRVLAAADHLNGLGYSCTRLATTEGERGWERGYLGVNSNWLTPDGALFELQFHTELTWHAKSESHEAYETWREDPDDPVLREANTRRYQQCFRSGASALGVEAWKLDGVSAALDAWFARHGRA